MKRFSLFLFSAALAVAQTVTIPWENVSKSGASLADLPTRTFAALQSTPTTLAGYGITDAQPLDSDLTSIAALTTTTFGRSLLAFASANSSVLYTDGSGNWVLGTTLPAVSGVNLTALNATQLTSGTLPAARLPAFTGDVATSAGSAATTLSTTGVSAGTYKSVTVDTKGRVSAGTNPTTLSGYGITDAYTSTTVDQMVSSRAVKDALYSDGATTNRGVVWTLGSAGAVAGMPITIPFECDVPASNPVTDGQLVWITSSTSTFNNSLLLTLTTTGALRLRQYGADFAADQRTLSYAGFRSAFSGVKGLRGVVVFAAGDTTTAPTIYIQGADVSASFTSSTSGTAANWMPATLATTILVEGYGWPTGRIVPHGPCLGAWTADEAAEWASTGRMPGWCELGTGSAANIIANSDTESAITGWLIVNAGASSGTVTQDTSAPISGAASAKLTVTTTSLGPYPRVAISSSLGGLPWPTRRRYIGEIKVKGPAGKALSYGPTGGGADPKWLMSVTMTGAVQTLTFDSTVGASGTTSITLIPNSSDGEEWWFDDAKIYAAGPLIRPVLQPIAVVADSSSNAIAGVLTGMVPLTTRRDWIIQANTSTNGNQQLLGASPFFDYTRNIIDDWVVNNKGASSRTISLGSTSAGTQYLSSGTAATGRNVVTLATKVVGANALWCNSNGTDSLQHTIRGHIVD